MQRTELFCSTACTTENAKHRHKGIMIRQVPGPPKFASFLQKCTTAITVVRFPAFNNVLEVVIYTNADCNTFTHNTDKRAIQETAELEVVCVVQVREVCSAVHKGRPCQPCKQAISLRISILYHGKMHH